MKAAYRGWDKFAEGTRLFSTAPDRRTRASPRGIEAGVARPIPLHVHREYRSTDPDAGAIVGRNRGPIV